jgi:3-oxoacyl-[acyl-carrier-protein] synthase III
VKIAAIAHALPGTRIDLDWILRKLERENSATLCARDRATVLDKTATFLHQAGSATRYQLAAGEQPIDLLAQVGRAALTAGEIASDEIDFVIYAGVARGWLEPATAHAVQAAIGARNATCFDVLDGCASWLRALQIARAMLHAGDHRRGLIVNGELGFARYGRWQFSSVEEFDDYVATYTIGEAATATVVTASGTSDDFYCTFRSIGEAYHLCMIPLANAVDFMPTKPSAVHVREQFFSQSKELMATAIKLIGETFHGDPILSKRTYDITFGHEASEKATAAVTRILRQRPERHFAIHRDYGNAVAASVPLAMSLALERGRLQRGDQVLAVVAASGITIGFAAFTF